MTLSRKISILQDLYGRDEIRVGEVYEILEKCELIKFDYTAYMTTAPIDCDIELLRLANADYDTCCALITMILREDRFKNGSFDSRWEKGQVREIFERLIFLLKKANYKPLKYFSEKALEAMNGCYVYALIDPRNNEIFYIGKGTDNRIFSHEIENDKSPLSEKSKLKKIREIEKAGFSVKRIIVNRGLTEKEAFTAEASLINLMRYISPDILANEISGHHSTDALSVEEFDMLYGAEKLKPDEIKHNILVIKINQLYRRDMLPEELYNVVRGYWRASLNTIRNNNIEYVFGVYNQLIVAVYKPDEWHYIHENINAPHQGDWGNNPPDRLKNRIYFVCKDYAKLDDEGKFYLHKSIADLKVNQSAQNPITYLLLNNKNQL